MRGNLAISEEELAIPEGNKALCRAAKKKKKCCIADARCFVYLTETNLILCHINM